MGGFELQVTKHRDGLFTLEVHSLFRYTGWSARAESLSGVLDAAIMELGLSVHEVGKVSISVRRGEQLEPDEEVHGKFFSGYLILQREENDSARAYLNSRCRNI